MSWITSARRALSRAVRADSWFNLMSGVGASGGRASMSFQVLPSEYLGLADLEQLYNFDGVAARICDAVPEHALRQGFTVSTGDTKVETALTDALDALDALGNLKRAWTWARVFGGGAVYIGADDGEAPDRPLDERALRRILWLNDVDRRDLIPLTWDTDPRSGRFGKPVTYTLHRMGGTATQTVVVHHSRLLRFDGVTPTRRRRLALQGWGESVLQRCYQELVGTRGAFAASGELVQQASQGVLKLKGLMDMISSDTDDLVKRRLHLMDLSRSVARSLLLDADGEDFTRVDAGSLSGVADIMDRAVNLLSGTSRIPVSVLLGTAQAGLGATEDPNLRTWYDTLQADRGPVLRPELRRLVRLLLLSREGPARGQEPDGWKVALPSLWQLTPEQEADVRSKQASTDQIYLTAQVITPEEVALSRFRKEGWSADTSIDLEVREAVVQADRAATAAVPPPADGASKVLADLVARVEARADGMPERYGHISFTPPKGAREAAARALEVRAEKPESQRGMTAVGLARARDLSNGATLSPETVRRMKAYFDRHEGDKTGETWDEQGPGWQAWQGWGGDAGYAWARKVVAQMEAADREEDG